MLRAEGACTMLLRGEHAVNRATYFNFCESKLSTLCTRIELRGKLNLLEFNIHAEDFYANFLNLLFDYSLTNINQMEQNAEGLDLVDNGGKLVLQVSSTATKTKVESALKKNLASYTGFGFKFVSIAKDASHLRSDTYSNPHKLVFDPSVDIFDVKTLLTQIQHAGIVKQRAVYDFLSKELTEDEKPLTESNLAAVIKIIAAEDLAAAPEKIEPIPFDLDKKLTFNNLITAAVVVEDYKVHYGRVTKLYATFDKEGKNKSKSVLDSFRKGYIKLSATYSGDELFFRVVEAATERVLESANYEAMPAEELDLCITILAVDAFIRCRIFKRPEGMIDAAA